MGGFGGLGGFKVSGFTSTPHNYPLPYPKYPLLRAIRTLLEGSWGVLVGFRILIRFLVKPEKRTTMETTSSLQGSRVLRFRDLEGISWGSFKGSLGVPSKGSVLGGFGGLWLRHYGFRV